MIVLILVVFCTLVYGQNNYYSNPDVIVFPDSDVYPQRGARKTENPNKNSDSEYHRISLELAQKLNSLESDELFNIIEDLPETEKVTSFVSRMGDGRASVIKPKPAKCTIEIQTVSLLPEHHDSSTVYLPSCTRMKRCGGCCNHSLLTCRPNATELRNIEVLETKVDEIGKLRYKGKKIVVMEEHVSCECGCKIRPEDCTKSHSYSDTQCRCVCNNIDEENKCKRDPALKLWDPDTCQCTCRNQADCGSGFFFNPNTCRCEQRRLSVQPWYNIERAVGHSTRQNEKDPIIIPLDSSDSRRRHKDEPEY